MDVKESFWSACSWEYSGFSAQRFRAGVLELAGVSAKSTIFVSDGSARCVSLRVFGSGLLGHGEVQETL